MGFWPCADFLYVPRWGDDCHRRNLAFALRLPVECIADRTGLVFGVALSAIAVHGHGVERLDPPAPAIGRCVGGDAACAFGADPAASIGH